jgi:hypothetical protein
LEQDAREGHLANEGADAVLHPLVEDLARLEHVAEQLHEADLEDGTAQQVLRVVHEDLLFHCRRLG